MTKYLDFNGTTDVLYTPSVTTDKVVLDIVLDSTQLVSYAYYFQIGSTTPFERIQNSSSFYGSGITSKSGEVLGTRATITLNYTSLSGQCILFNRYTNTTNTYMGKGKLYSAKFYNAGVLVASYDMSTGTVNDQSGNGYNATLLGGTWLDDGAGATGTPVTYTYDTKQTIFKNINLNADTKQSIFANRLTNYDTKQIQYKNIQTSYDSKQMIYKAIQELFDTEQVFTQEYTQVNYNYDVKIEQYKPIQESIDTKQTIYKDISVDLDTKQIVYKTIQTLYDTLIELRNEHDKTLYATLTIQRVIEHHLRINQGHEDTLKIQRAIEHILRI